MNVRHIILTDTEDTTEPPQMTAMRLSVVGDEVYIALGDLTEDFDRVEFVADSQIQVQGGNLLDSLSVLGRSEDRRRDADAPVPAPGSLGMGSDEGLHISDLAPPA